MHLDNLHPQVKSIIYHSGNPVSVHSALAVDENHTNTTGAQAVNVNSRNINDGYYPFKTYDNIDMSVSNTSVDLRTAPEQQPFVVDAGTGDIDFTANNLNT